MSKPRIFSMSFAKVYPLLVAKAERKGRTRSEVDHIIRWLTGYSQERLEQQLVNAISYENFFDLAPRMNPLRSLITGVICGVRIEEIEEPLMREIRYLDKLVDELAKGRSMDRILRSPPQPGGRLPEERHQVGRGSRLRAFAGLHVRPVTSVGASREGFDALSRQTRGVVVARTVG